MGRTLDYFFYTSHIHHNFPYKLIPVSMSYLKYFGSYQRKQYSAFNYWDDFNVCYTGCPKKIAEQRGSVLFRHLVRFLGCLTNA